MSDRRIAAHRAWVDQEGWMILDGDLLTACLIKRGISTSDLPALLALAAERAAEEAGEGDPDEAVGSDRHPSDDRGDGREPPMTERTPPPTPATVANETTLASGLLRPHELDMVRRAKAALEFRAGFEEGGGVPESVRRIGSLADSVIELADGLASARSVALALGDRVDRQEALLASRAGAALKGPGR